MAWPCITRACCINRFWTELDKADIAVPLVFTKYSDVADGGVHPHPHHHHLQHLTHHPQPRQKRAGAEQHQHQSHPDQEKAPPASTATAAGAAAGKDGSAASVMRQDFKAWRVQRPEPSCKPRNEFQRSAAPFNNETQYQKDYKPWPIPKKHDHPWIPKGATEAGVEKSEIEEKIQEKEAKEVTVVRSATKRDKSSERPVEKTERQVVAVAEKQAAVQAETEGQGQPQVVEVEVVAAGESAERRGRAAADALNRQIKEVMSTSSSYRTEFKAYKDVKPVKPIKAASQYKPPVEESESRETSYSATYKGEQAKAHPTDNKLLERRRVRSLYSEPGKDAPAKDKAAPRTRPKKTPTTTTGKMVKKSKEKQLAGSQAAKKKSPLDAAEPKPEAVVTKKSKEISNRLAEAKQ